MTTQACKHGFCDGLFNRESNSQWKDYPRQSEYIKGYLQGQALRMQGAGNWLLQ